MYVTLADLRAAAPHLELTAQTKPTSGDAEQWIKDAELSLNAILSNLGYKVPIIDATSPISFAIVKDMVVQVVLARVLRARFLGLTTAANEAARDAQKYYDERIKWLTDPMNEFELIDAVRIDIVTAVKPRGYRIASGFSDTETEDAETRPRAAMDQIF